MPCTHLCFALRRSNLTSKLIGQREQLVAAMEICCDTNSQALWVLAWIHATTPMAKGVLVLQAVTKDDNMYFMQPGEVAFLAKACSPVHNDLTTRIVQFLRTKISSVFSCHYTDYELLRFHMECPDVWTLQELKQHRGRQGQGDQRWTTISTSTLEPYTKMLKTDGNHQIYE